MQNEVCERKMAGTELLAILDKAGFDGCFSKNHLSIVGKFSGTIIEFLDSRDIPFDIKVSLVLREEFIPGKVLAEMRYSFSDKAAFIYEMEYPDNERLRDLTKARLSFSRGEITRKTLGRIEKRAVGVYKDFRKIMDIKNECHRHIFMSMMAQIFVKPEGVACAARETFFVTRGEVGNEFLAVIKTYLTDRPSKELNGCYCFEPSDESRNAFAIGQPDRVVRRFVRCRNCGYGRFLRPEAG